jgi:hypothetical protein
MRTLDIKNLVYVIQVYASLALLLGVIVLVMSQAFVSQETIMGVLR